MRVRKSPPLNSKVTEKDENLNEFFIKNIEFYKEHMRQHYSYGGNCDNTNIASSLTPLSPEHRNIFLEEPLIVKDTT